jgi:hypothetical protein
MSCNAPSEVVVVASFEVADVFQSYGAIVDGVFYSELWVNDQLTMKRHCHCSTCVACRIREEIRKKGST